MYILENVSNVYKELFGEFHNEAYWTPCHKPRICLDLKMKRNSKDCFVSSRIHTKMDIQELGQPKRCSICRIPGHSKNKYPHCVGSSQQR